MKGRHEQWAGQAEPWRPGKWMRAGTALVLLGVLVGSTGCDDDDDGENRPLSEQAQRGLEISPFPLDVNGLSSAEKEQLGIGSYIVNATTGCGDCHDTVGPNGPPKYLGGGTPFPLSSSGEVIYARNLTPDPDTGMKLTEAEFIDTMRTGRDYLSENDAEVMPVMPWLTYRWMSTADLKAIYAYLKRVPPVRNPVPADIKGAFAAGRPLPFPSSFNEGEVDRALPAENSSDSLFISRGLAIHPRTDPPGFASLSAQERDRYGRGSYLVNALSDCSGCHTNPARNLSPGPNFGKVTTTSYLTGGMVFAVPPGLNAMSKMTRTMSSNLLGATHGFMNKSKEEFYKAIKQGEVTKGGTTRKLGFSMPVVSLGKLVDEDVEAIYTYLKHQTRLQGTVDKVTQPPARWCASAGDCASGESCNTATNECVGGSCTQDSDCGVCQTCSQNRCEAPAASSTCLQSGI